jgi:hypothetical protein
MTADEMRVEADRLVLDQRKHRGYRKWVDVEGKRCKVLGSYEPTQDAEDRARRIVDLRRKAAELDS